MCARPLSPLGIVRRARVDLRVEAEDGSLVALAEHECQAVRQHLDRGAGLEVLLEGVLCARLELKKAL